MWLSPWVFRFGPVALHESRRPSTPLPHTEVDLETDNARSKVLGVKQDPQPVFTSA